MAICQFSNRNQEYTYLGGIIGLQQFQVNGLLICSDRHHGWLHRGTCIEQSILTGGLDNPLKRDMLVANSVGHRGLVGVEIVE